MMEAQEYIPASYCKEKEYTVPDFLGYIDAHLLAAVTLTDSSRLWTRDKRLHAVAESLSLNYP